MITEVDLGWAAAVLDCRGRVSLKKNKSRATVQRVIWADSKSEAIITRLSTMTGSGVEVKQNRILLAEWDRRGCVEHCPEPHVHEQRKNMPEIYKWQATGTAAAVVLYNLMPYLTDQESWRGVMTAALEDATTSGRGSGTVKLAVTRLSDLGWRLPASLFGALMAKE